MKYYFTFTYPKNLQPCSVSSLLKKLLIPRKWCHYLRIQQAVTVNGRYRYFNQLVEPGDLIALTLANVESNQQEYPASGKLPQIVYEDANLLIINKPGGQKTHPNLAEANTALNDCATYLGYSPFIIHRLDMLTNGLLLVAKNPAVVPILNRELTTKTFKRNYFAGVTNAAQLAPSGSINLPIEQDPLDQRKRRIAQSGRGLAALTHYRIREQKGNTALVELALKTGRTHQIRVHLAAIGCPIIGDPLYNPQYQAGDALQLTAYQIELIKPFSFTPLKVTLPNLNHN